MSSRVEVWGVVCSATNSCIVGGVLVDYSQNMKLPLNYFDGAAFFSSHHVDRCIHLDSLKSRSKGGFVSRIFARTWEHFNLKCVMEFCFLNMLKSIAC